MILIRDTVVLRSSKYICSFNLLIQCELRMEGGKKKKEERK